RYTGSIGKAGIDGDCSVSFIATCQLLLKHRQGCLWLGGTMASFSNPLLFSDHFKIGAEQLAKAGLIDPFLTVDTQLFVDPILLDKSGNKIIREDAYHAFRKHFENVIRLLVISVKEGDAAWKGAQSLFSLREAPANGLGYGKSDRPGTSRPEA